MATSVGLYGLWIWRTHVPLRPRCFEGQSRVFALVAAGHGGRAATLVMERDETRLEVVSRDGGRQLTPLERAGTLARLERTRPDFSSVRFDDLFVLQVNSFCGGVAREMIIEGEFANPPLRLQHLLTAPSLEGVAKLVKASDPRRRAAAATAMQLVNEAF